MTDSINNLDNSDEISVKEMGIKLKQLQVYLRSKWLLICSVGIIGGVLGGAYAWIKKPAYSAITTFVLEEGGASGGGLGPLSGLASMAGFDVNGGGGGIFQGDNILELYKSRRMIKKTLLTSVDHNGKKELLIDHYLMFNGIREKWDKNPKLKGLSFSNPNNFGRIQDSILNSITFDINKNYLNVVKPEKKLNIIRAEVKGPDEFFSKEFNDQIVKNVSDFYVQTKTKKSLDNIAILQTKTDSVRNVMNGAIYTAAAISDATPNLNPTRQVQRIAPVQKSQFNAETNKAVLGELVKNLELSKMSLLKETPLIQVIDSPVYPLSVNSLGKLKGFVIGGFLGVFIICILLMVRRLFSGVA
ncbi:hypothetical protein PBAL39_05318 [Pedobacter sp. BAL39]|uniref:LPS biosynthesis protein n=1 Tax=Pedobacter sp. BAL39 TaxID=391596 RepID=UPI00015597FC|nr:LPS biosynthesis protein [Pedobacter sp. BAL39]EDM37192.1 hypothetical protein PBAL39_05318 [Pedobacter sp. BAL39]